jgi:hypothetical protein
VSKGNYLEKKLLDHVFGKAAFTAPANIYVAASTADPTEDGSGLAEPSGNNYSRVSTAAADWNAATLGAGTLTNANAINFPVASGSWGTITHVALYDASSGGNLLYKGAISPSQAIGTANQLVILAGQFTVTED